MDEYIIAPLGDQAITFSLKNQISPSLHGRIMSMYRWLEEQSFPGVRDIVVAYNSLTILYDVFTVRSQFHFQGTVYDFFKGKLLDAYSAPQVTKGESTEIKHVPVCYDPKFAPDLEVIAENRKLMTTEVIQLHTTVIYTVYMIGFLPGFAYMGEVDEQIAMPRRQQPRPLIEAGSVGIAGKQTGIYPLNSPGGWQIIGRTPLKLFNPGSNPPSMFESGDKIKFYEISRAEFNDMASA
jgi:inhibitor of KinA